MTEATPEKHHHSLDISKHEHEHEHTNNSAQTLTQDKKNVHWFLDLRLLSKLSFFLFNNYTIQGTMMEHR